MRKPVRAVGPLVVLMSAVAVAACGWDPLSAYDVPDVEDMDSPEPDTDAKAGEVEGDAVEDLGHDGAWDMDDGLDLVEAVDGEAGGDADAAAETGDGGIGQDGDADVEPSECEVDEDCTGPAPPCHQRSCVDGTCVAEPVDDGMPCDDGDACTAGDTCQAGLCASGAPKVCTASDACHEAGACDPATGECSDPASADGKVCDDGLVCTDQDACNAGVCVGSPVTCAAPIVACAVASCEETSQGCVTDASACECLADADCGAGHVCTAGDCVCVPACDGKACGSDGCGGSCGSCEDDQSCTLQGQCVCQPDCAGKQCGDDGCGGSCGSCGVGTECSPEATCVCVPACDGRECGSDGCGGSCGSCGSGEACSAQGQCVCQPDCAGKQCGDNGCGGLCGVCGSGLVCGDANQCVQPPCGLLGEPCPSGFTCDASAAVGTSYPAFCLNQTTGEVWVPAGTLWMGCNALLDSDCESKESPQHLVTVDQYAIDRLPVTVTAFKACVAAGACVAPSSGDYSTYWSSGKESHPVNYVSWSQASAYCAWSGKAAGTQRLCTEAEWERAARGGCETLTGDCASNMRLYPWGSADATCTYAVIWESQPGCGTDTSSPPGLKPAGTSPYGASDMGGGMRTWVSDWYAAYDSAPATNPAGPASGTQRVTRGGSFALAGSHSRSSMRFSTTPTSKSYLYGVRCCRPIQ